MASAIDAEGRPSHPWKILINEPGLIGTIRTHSCTYGSQAPYSVAVLNVSDSPIAEGIELIEPQLLMLGDQALILRGYRERCGSMRDARQRSRRHRRGGSKTFARRQFNSIP